MNMRSKEWSRNTGEKKTRSEGRGWRRGKNTYSVNILHIKINSIAVL
jgi:hypothetical protein